jgi:hypothetical protein
MCCEKNVRAWVSMISYFSKEVNKNYYVRERKNSWEPFRMCLLNSTANPATRIFFYGISKIIFILLFRYETIEFRPMPLHFC